MEGYTLAFMKLVKPEDLNPAARLFGGRLLEWADEAFAMYAMFEMKTKRVVTKKVSEVVFHKAVGSGELLHFYARNKHVGTTSLTVECVVERPKLFAGDMPPGPILSCDFVFVAIDMGGRPVPHNMVVP